MDEDVTVVRIITYQGSKEWVNNTLRRSLIAPNGTYWCGKGSIESTTANWPFPDTESSPITVYQPEHFVRERREQDGE